MKAMSKQLTPRSQQKNIREVIRNISHALCIVYHSLAASNNNENVAISVLYYLSGKPFDAGYNGYGGVATMVRADYHGFNVVELGQFENAIDSLVRAQMLPLFRFFDIGHLHDAKMHDDKWDTITNDNRNVQRDAIFALAEQIIREEQMRVYAPRIFMSVGDVTIQGFTALTSLSTVATVHNSSCIKEFMFDFSPTLPNDKPAWYSQELRVTARCYHPSFPDYADEIVLVKSERIEYTDSFGYSVKRWLKEFIRDYKPRDNPFDLTRKIITTA